jgi:HlyD family secretion protein
VVVVAIGAFVAVSAAKKEKGTEVRIEAVSQQDLVASVTASGQVIPRTKVDLSADITGRITRLSVKDGDYVKEGQFLLQIDPQQYEAQVSAPRRLWRTRGRASRSRAPICCRRSATSSARWRSGRSTWPSCPRRSSSSSRPSST